MIRLDAARFVLFQAGPLDESRANWEAVLPSVGLVRSRSRYTPSEQEIESAVERDYES